MAGSGSTGHSAANVERQHLVSSGLLSGSGRLRCSRGYRQLRARSV